MIKREDRKRPCDQCRNSKRWSYNHEGWTGEESQMWSNCCGEWIYTYKTKLEWRRPRPWEKLT